MVFFTDAENTILVERNLIYVYSIRFFKYVINVRVSRGVFTPGSFRNWERFPPEIRLLGLMWTRQSHSDVGQNKRVEIAKKGWSRRPGAVRLWCESKQTIRRIYGSRTTSKAKVLSNPSADRLICSGSDLIINPYKTYIYVKHLSVLSHSC